MSYEFLGADMGKALLMLGSLCGSEGQKGALGVGGAGSNPPVRRTELDVLWNQWRFWRIEEFVEGLLLII